MTSLDIIKIQIQKFYKENRSVHINAVLTASKVTLKDEPVLIKGVYPHIFRIEERSSGKPKCHTFQYTDVLLHHIEIAELERI